MSKQIQYTLYKKKPQMSRTYISSPRTGCFVGSVGIYMGTEKRRAGAENEKRFDNLLDNYVGYAFVSDERTQNRKRGFRRSGGNV